MGSLIGNPMNFSTVALELKVIRLDAADRPCFQALDNEADLELVVSVGVTDGRDVMTRLGPEGGLKS